MVSMLTDVSSGNLIERYPGSLAAWAQSLFFGATVRKGSWFSALQSAAMKKGL
ncbi:hypothetical protein CPB84DRAFT_1786908 [Gymnopilus junonius]|uniref:Uncharacterized protein n=1 Tax=Gymnopilus junonius TaxID=109634 RepID=A0A9P5NGY2_GYMJU|nr:hypothetical protein CPB84DRAFT_1786908 [Gymnopilus junonius]